MQLIKLLNNAILKLNKDGLYHFDIKGANILLGQDGHTRLTDWGSSFEYQSSKDSIHIPFKLYDRAIFQYNVPFSVILFSDELLNLLKEKKPRSTSSSSKTIAQNDVVAKMLSQESILFSIKENGIGHFENILEFMIMVYRDIFDNKKFTRDNAIQMIQDYLADIFLNYFDFTTYTFNLPAFFNEVFLHNVDLYGFILTYIELVMPNNINIISIIKSNKNYFALVNELSLIFNEFCWSPRYASKPIPHKTLTTRLNRLNIIASE